MSSLLALAARRHPLLVVLLLGKRPVRDAAGAGGGIGLGNLARAFGGIQVPRARRHLVLVVPVAFVVLNVRPRLFWHLPTSGDTVASTMPPAIEFRDVSFTR